VIYDLSFGSKQGFDKLFLWFKTKRGTINRTPAALVYFKKMLRF
jgi:hypothetical protein